MTYEAVAVDLFGTNGDGRPIYATCASGTAISKGTILEWLDPRTVRAGSAYCTSAAGIAAMDKANNDYSTTIAVWTDGIFDIKTSAAAIAVGSPVAIWDAFNTVSGCDQASCAAILGKALETSATSEVIHVRVNL